MKLVILLGLITVSVQASIEIQKGSIEIKNDSQFEALLETRALIKLQKATPLSETGFILGTIQFSFEDGKPSSNWVTMDEKFLNREKVDLKGLKFPKGTAYGILYTSLDFSARLKIGQELSVRRYGIAKDNFKGKIHKLVARAGQDVIQVHFLVDAEELIPGTSCEISINDIRLNPSQVSLLSLLHIGLEDYVVIKTGPGTYTPKHITILDQDTENAVVMFPSTQGETYVARGAILLKPLLSKILSHEETEHD